MATVYRAHDLRHNRRVAIKVLRPELAAVICISSGYVRECETEVEYATLNHPTTRPESGVACVPGSRTGQPVCRATGRGSGPPLRAWQPRRGLIQRCHRSRVPPLQDELERDQE
jgi:hypothetical protein